MNGLSVKPTESVKVFVSRYCAIANSSSQSGVTGGSIELTSCCNLATQ